MSFRVTRHRSATGRASAVILASLLALSLGPSWAGAQAVDVSGAWALEVTTDQGVTHPTVTFEQDGATLTGSYSSEALGRARVRGTVEGSRVSWSFDAELQGQPIPVAYDGTVGEDGTISGTIDIAGGMLTGRFTARRPEGGGAPPAP